MTVTQELLQEGTRMVVRSQFTATSMAQCTALRDVGRDEIAC